ncbi:MAG TPA: glycosyltransferase family 2 protein [Candidatus Marinimicrobia bacterium]|nr:glycosyltransferase family 2 protein [Candidatus Neomarinimicrobiota bacterium]
MYKEHEIAVVVPAYNEETQIGKVLSEMPQYIDHIVVVNDCSDDKTAEITEQYANEDSRILLLNHDQNQGVGGAIATGYKWSKDRDVDIAVVMAGDGQMDPADLSLIMDPVVEGRVDYSKGNRLLTGEAFKIMPKVRYFGNSALSLLTKIASGYWHIADSQAGYTAIHKKVLHTIDWDRMYRRYGQPNDLLVRLNVYNFKVQDVVVKPVYNVGEKSGIRVGNAVFTIGWLLLKLFLWRLKEKYIIRDFHPLVFFYGLGAVLTLASMFFLTRLFWIFLTQGFVPDITALAFVFCFVSALHSIFFAMWFDLESNKHLR